MSLFNRLMEEVFLYWSPSAQRKPKICNQIGVSTGLKTVVYSSENVPTSAATIYLSVINRD